MSGSTNALASGPAGLYPCPSARRHPCSDACAGRRIGPCTGLSARDRAHLYPGCGCAPACRDTGLLVVRGLGCRGACCVGDLGCGDLGCGPCPGLSARDRAHLYHGCGYGLGCRDTGLLLVRGLGCRGACCCVGRGCVGRGFATADRVVPLLLRLRLPAARSRALHRQMGRARS